MSRLDYVTIAIVVLCVLAIGFLVYKMTDLFKGDAAADKTEVAADSIEMEDDGSYDYEIDTNVDSTGANATGGNGQSSQPGASAPATQPVTSTTPSSTEKTKDASATAAEDDSEAGAATDDAPTASAGGKYMVIGGSFTVRANAEKEANRLKKMGYDNASVEIFDRGKLAVVLVDRFTTMAEAEKLVKELKDDKVSAIVKTKQG